MDFLSKSIDMKSIFKRWLAGKICIYVINTNLKKRPQIFTVQSLKQVKVEKYLKWTKYHKTLFIILVYVNQSTFSKG